MKDIIWWKRAVETTESESGELAFYSELAGLGSLKRENCDTDSTAFLSVKTLTHTALHLLYVKMSNHIQFSSMTLSASFMCENEQSHSIQLSDSLFFCPPPSLIDTYIF